MNFNRKMNCLNNMSHSKRVRNVAGMLSEEKKCKRVEYLLRYSATQIFIAISILGILVVGGGVFVAFPVQEYVLEGATLILVSVLFVLIMSSAAITYIQEIQLDYADLAAYFINVPVKTIKGIYLEFDKTLKELKKQ